MSLTCTSLLWTGMDTHMLGVGRDECCGGKGGV